MRNLIRVGEPRRWVYCLKHLLPARVQVNKVVSYDTWHYRLGHPSSQALSNLSFISSNDSKHELCEVCLCAKQTRMSFPISENKAMNCFDIFTVTYGVDIMLSHFRVLNIFLS